MTERCGEGYWGTYNGRPCREKAPCAHSLPSVTGIKMPRFVLTVAMAFLALLSWGASASGYTPASVPNTLKQRIAACTSCHGANGEGGTNGFNPRLAGKPATYLYHQLLNFRDGRRHYPLMTYMLRPLSDAYLHEIATYFSALDTRYPERHPPRLSSTELARGRTLVHEGDPGKGIPACQACHGARLTGVEPAIPGLLGLPYSYLSAQLGAWRNGTRRMRKPDCMKHVADRLDARDIRAVAAWLAAQPIPAEDRAQAASSPGHDLPLRCGSVEIGE
jgi:cytochrome c553